jgi:hypothetical protein
MDPLTHLLVTRKLIDTRRSVVLAGVLPDAPFYLTYPAWVLTHGGFRRAIRQSAWPEPPSWMPLLHHMFHSLPVALLVALGYRLVRGQWPRDVLAAWTLHIAIDLPTHSRRQWAPQFLWPISDITVDGRSWVDVAIWLVRKLAR